ncbi:MAG: MaoC family dehydratase [Hydrogenophaga sp.]|uniref:MaoC family dehydratase n=1 Tax=Hydrogenophaga sp. TaxID=1904254 RepID=UPI003D0E9A6E
MLIIEPPSRLADQVGQTIGPGDWLTVDQAMIDAFADLTGDRQWIHVDTGRAAREMPGGKTIAHGFLVLALLGRLMPPLYDVRGASRILNYGSDRLRFLNVVPAGARVRASIQFKSVEPVPGGRKCVTETSIEVEGQPRPALVAESIFLYYD